MTDTNAIRIKKRDCLNGQPRFFVPAGFNFDKGNEMSTSNVPKITGKIVGVSRRRFLSGTAAIATAGAVLLPPQIVDADEPVSLEQMANAIHEAAGRYATRNAPFQWRRRSPSTLRSTGLDFAMENLRYCSVDEIQCALKPLFGGAS